jgi:hypothetical protein
LEEICKLLVGMNLGSGIEESDPTVFYAVGLLMLFGCSCFFPAVLLLLLA